MRSVAVTAAILASTFAAVGLAMLAFAMVSMWGSALI